MKIKLSRLILPLILCFLLLAVLFNINKITDTFVNILEKKPEIVIKEANNYRKNYSFGFIKLENNYIPYAYQDLLNIIYSTLNNGWESFTFYCPKEYIDCIKDIKSITEDEILLTNINNFVHPYNSFSNLKTVYDHLGEITLKITKLYNSDEIERLNNEVNKVIDTYITDIMTTEEKIKVIHDYIINNTVYDSVAAKNIKNYSRSNTALGALFDKKALCGGYSDTMALFLHKLDVRNFKIASDNHVWNAVFVNDQWKHLDLTWDDPISEDNQNYLLYKFFLIDTDTLHKEDVKSHIFDYLIYHEFNN